MAAGHEGGFFSDAHSWVFLATVIFAVVAFRLGRKPILAILDSRTAKIKNDLEEAERLRIEAQELLAQYQRKHRDALKTAEEIVTHARESVKRIHDEANKNLEESLKRKEAQILDKIARTEAAAVEEVRNQTADLAIIAARRMLLEALEGDGKDLIDQSIGKLSGQIN